MEYKNLGMSTRDFKKEVLEGMCECADTLHQYLEIPACANLTFIDEPISFKPSSGDKLIFKKMVNDYFPIIAQDYSPRWTNPTYVGFQIYLKQYVPRYGESVDLMLKQELNQLNK